MEKQAFEDVQYLLLNMVMFQLVMLVLGVGAGVDVFFNWTNWFPSQGHVDFTIVFYHELGKTRSFPEILPKIHGVYLEEHPV